MVGAGVEAGMQFVLAHAETPAAVMAGAYAELTGSPGACVVTRGPGAASAANGVAQAQLDRQPLVVVTDSVSPSEAGRISHQRIDQRAFFAPLAKRSMRIGHDRAEELAADAVELARTPPARVVHLDVAPRDPSDPGPPTTPPRSSPIALAQAHELHDAPVVLLGEWAIDADYFGAVSEVVGPLAELLPLVQEAVARSRGPAELRSGYLAQRDLLEAPVAGLGPHEVVRAVRDVAGDALVTVDAGAHMLVAMALWHTDDPNAVLISSGLATMGFALPAAIGGAIAQPGRRVVCLTGDGGLGMTLAELEMISRLALPIAVTVFNDSALRLIELKQDEAAHGGSNAVRYRDIDFAGAARALGVAAHRVASVPELERALSSGVGEDPVVIDAVVDPSGYGDVLRAIRGARASV